MSSSRKLVVLVAVAAVAGALIYWYGAYPQNQRAPFIEGGNNTQSQDQMSDSDTAGVQQVSSPEKVVLPEVSGNIDGAVDAIIKGASVDQAAAISEDEDNSVVSLDSQDINDFGQSYNENNY
jgi:hypothetical protein